MLVMKKINTHLNTYKLWPRRSQANVIMIIYPATNCVQRWRRCLARGCLSFCFVWLRASVLMEEGTGRWHHGKGTSCSHLPEDKTASWQSRTWLQIENWPIMAASVCAPNPMPHTLIYTCSPMKEAAPWQGGAYFGLLGLGVSLTRPSRPKNPNPRLGDPKLCPSLSPLWYLWVFCARQLYLCTSNLI